MYGTPGASLVHQRCSHAGPMVGCTSGEVVRHPTSSRCRLGRALLGNGSGLTCQRGYLVRRSAARNCIRGVRRQCRCPVTLAVIPITPVLRLSSEALSSQLHPIMATRQILVASPWIKVSNVTRAPVTSATYRWGTNRVWPMPNSSPNAEFLPYIHTIGLQQRDRARSRGQVSTHLARYLSAKQMNETSRAMKKPYPPA